MTNPIRLSLLIALVSMSSQAMAQKDAVLSDDGAVVTVAKTPNALRLSDFSNHLGIVPPGTRVRAFETKRDPVVPATWVKVKILDGEYKGKTGWALSQTVHIQETKSDENESTKTGDRLGRARTPSEEPKDVVKADKSDSPPPSATHRVISGTGIFTSASFRSVSGMRLSAGDWIQKVDAKDDSVTSHRWIKMRVLSGRHKDQTGWVASNDVKSVEGVLIIYGRGDTFDFKIFADDLRRQLAKDFDQIEIMHIEDRDTFFEKLKSTEFPFTIAQFHIFSHSFGGALSLGYRGDEPARSRQAVFDRAAFNNRLATAEEVRQAEVGMVFTETLREFKYVVMSGEISKKLSSDAFIKIWGCNAGSEDHIYEDDIDFTNDGNPDPWWTQLNIKGKRPSIAQAFADYFKRKVLAATSGAHIEVLDKNEWITTTAFEKKYGKPPSGNLSHRLHPDKGDYVPFSPAK